MGLTERRFAASPPQAQCCLVKLSASRHCVHLLCTQSVDATSQVLGTMGTAAV